MIDQSTERSGAHTGDRILALAARLFHERGYGATGVATILRGAGVQSGSLYHFFANKEALLAAVVERHLAQLRPTIFEPVERAADDPVARVLALLEHYRRGLVMSGCTMGCPVGNLALEVGDRLPEVRVLIDRYFSGWTHGVRRWFEAAGDRLPADLDRAALSRFVLSVMQGGVMQARAHGGLEPFDASVAELRSHIQFLEDRARRERGDATRLPEGARPSVSGQRAPDIDRPEWRTW